MDWQGIMRRLALPAVFAVIATISTAASAAVPAGISGSWMNLAQGGHGLSVEILDDGRAIAFWFVYDASGRPVHLYIDGVVRDDAIVGTAYYNEGMRFGVFDPSTRTQTVWGDVTLTFIDCARGVLRYDASGPAGVGYGSGAMPITRLARIGMLGCRPGIPEALPVGFYDASVHQRNTTSAGQRDVPMAAAVDPDGRLWATPLQPPDTDSLFPWSFWKPLVIGTPTARAAGVSTYALKLLSAQVFMRREASQPPLFVTGALPETVTSSGITLPIATDPRYAESFMLGPRRTALSDIAIAFDPATLVGKRFLAPLEVGLFSRQVLITFGADGSLCLTDPEADSLDCAWRGAATAADPFLPFFDFYVNGTGARASETYAGRGWIEHSADSVAQRVVLVGADDRQGLGLVGQRNLP